MCQGVPIKQNFYLVLIFGLLAVIFFLAANRPPNQHFPAIDIEMSDSTAHVALNFVFESRSSLTECEMTNTRIAHKAMSQCPQCRITKLTCETTIDANKKNLLGTSPIKYPTGRMARGVVVFRSSKQEISLDACRLMEASTAGTPQPIKCYPSGAERHRLSGPTPSSNGLSAFLLLTAFVSSWFVNWLIIRYEHLHAHFSHDHVDSGPQKYHHLPTPRIGGVGVMTGLLASGGLMLFSEAYAIERTFGLLLIAALPAFLGGFLEDITKKVGVLERLLLTIMSGATAAWLLGAILDRLDIPGIDQALLWMPFAIPFTAFAIGGIANAINIIDGTNGLSSGFSVIVLVAMAYVANGAGDALVFNIAIALGGALLGFFVWNWPAGKIFLGDGGAYLVGFLLAELSVLLVARNPDVSPWFPLALLSYPVFETFYSIYRRKFQNKFSPGQPDNQHLHQLIHDNLLQHAGTERFNSNSLVAKYFWAPTIVLAVLSSIFYTSTPALLGCALCFCIFYVINYKRLEVRISRNVTGDFAGR